MVGRQFLAALALVLESRVVKENIMLSNIVTLKQRDIRRLKTADMKFVRCTARYCLLDHEGILEERHVDPVEKKLAQDI
jgi:hypothetical protein